jgi:aldose sugar dehydrogenase
MPARTCRAAFLLALAAGSSSPALAQDRTVQTAAGPLRLTTVAKGLEHPWALALLPDGRVLVTERNSGNLRIVARDGTLSQPVAGVPEVFRFEGESGRSQGGLFDVRLHPDFAQNRTILLSMAKPTERGAGVAVVSARLAEGSGQAARLQDVRELFLMKPADQDSSGLHFGGRMALAADNRHLFLSIGERRNISRSQDAGDQAGSILRMTLAGGVPADNPPMPPGEDDAGKPRPADPYVFAMGSRNSQALAIQPGTGLLWSAEHGPKGGDRVDPVRPGVNLGWPFITAATDYSGAPMGVGLSREGMQSPAHVFTETVAPSGAVFYTDDAIRGWRGSLLVGGMANQSLMRISTQGQKVQSVEKIDIGRRVRDVRVGPDGSIWMVTDHADGELMRLAPAGAQTRRSTSGG